MPDGWLRRLARIPRERARGIVAAPYRRRSAAHPLGSLAHGAVQGWAVAFQNAQSPSSVRKIINVLGSPQMGEGFDRLPANLFIVNFSGKNRASSI
jgi:hypothetical protein